MSLKPNETGRSASASLHTQLPVHLLVADTNTQASKTDNSRKASLSPLQSPSTDKHLNVWYTQALTTSN
jgi:hypothetical protein